MAGLVNSTTLPPIREEITLHPAPAAPDGSPAWTMADPARNLFFRINWPVFEILARWHEHKEERIVERILSETSLTVDAEDVQAVRRFLEINQLLRPVNAAATQRLTRIALTHQIRWFTWLLHHYLFFRVPLTHPDRLLTRTLHWVRPLLSRKWTLLMSFFALVTGFLLLRRWDLFQATLLNHLGPEGILSYGITLIGVKSVHELGHAYTAKHYGCRVPTMGVAFLVLFPMLYTDTTDAWKLPDKRHRLAIAFGGIRAELSLAILALLTWNLLPAGAGQEVAFWIATTSLATTLTINLSPFMRFDGYFLLSDWLDLPNLHERTFQLARWQLRAWLFGIDSPPPEPFPPRQHRFLVLFAWATWLYRLLLFLGIALLVYHFFIKSIGILLFLVEIIWFIFLPIWREVRAWPELHAQTRSRWRLPVLIGIGILILVTPWSTHIQAPAVLQGRSMLRIYVPEAAQLTRLSHFPAGRVTRGEELFALRTFDLHRQKQLANVRMGNAAWEISAAGLDTQWARRARIAQEERLRAATTLAGLENNEQRLILIAPFDGELVDRPPDLTTGTWLPIGFHLATLVDRSNLVVEAYVQEDDLTRLQTGSHGRFVPEVSEHPTIPVRLDTTQASTITELDDPLLVSVAGGPIPVRLQNRSLIPEGAWFRIRLAAESIPDWSPARLRGTLHLKAQPRSLLERWSRSALLVLVRELEM
ncbi:MAG: HlyD family efflux transporter periplasmic adaptor subunit [Magnetococcales bacterium]|nr:HlyD family efflux transporter periplasmic adaptor subunit [Magnetococcales bacterium]